jgi:hypothetical protein
MDGSDDGVGDGCDALRLSQSGNAGQTCTANGSCIWTGQPSHRYNPENFSGAISQ